MFYQYDIFWHKLWKSAPDGEHVEDDGEDSDNFLILLWLVQLLNLQISLRIDL